MARLIVTYILECNNKFKTSDCNGCSSGGNDNGANCYDLGINIYACRGTFSNGMEDSSTISICNSNQGYHVCTDAAEAASVGLTNTICDSLPTDELYFTQETSAGSAQCYTDYPSTGDKINGPRDDIWGCGGADICSSTSCGSTLTMFCTNSRGTPSYLDLGSDSKYEYDNIELRNASKGGVLCCPSLTGIVSLITFCVVPFVFSEFNFWHA